MPLVLREETDGLEEALLVRRGEGDERLEEVDRDLDVPRGSRYALFPFAAFRATA